MLKLPLFLDNIGSALTAALGGYIPGIVVGFFTNLVNSVGDFTTAYYGSQTVLIAIAAAWFGERDYFNFKKAPAPAGGDRDLRAHRRRHRLRC